MKKAEMKSKLGFEYEVDKSRKEMKFDYRNTSTGRTRTVTYKPVKIKNNSTGNHYIDDSGYLYNYGRIGMVSIEKYLKK